MPTTSDYLTQLQQDREDLVDNLEAKGITGLSGDETFTELVPEVLNIPSGSGGLDWSAIGYNEVPQFIQDGYNYAVEIKNNWTPSTNLSGKFSADKKLLVMPYVNTSTATDTSNMFGNCTELSSVPLLDMSNTTTIADMFYYCISLKYIPAFNFANATAGNSAFNGCTLLETVPQINTPKLKSMRYMFQYCTNLKNVALLDTSEVTGSSGFQLTFGSCPNLTDTSLDNILQMCINATKYSSTKTLTRLGITSQNYSASRIQALPHYQAFINAGWTIS